MAKKSMDWSLTLDTGILKVDHKNPEGEIVKSQEFTLATLFDGIWTELTDFQKNMIAYGAKQKMADACAVNKDMDQTINDRIVTLSNMWSRFEEGTWSQKAGERDTLKKKIEKEIAEAKVILTPELKAMFEKLGVKC
jgi:hypothetical protein